MVGYALRWGHPANIAEVNRSYKEIFVRGAFLSSIGSGRVRMCLEHEWNAIVATQADGSLSLIEDDVGLRIDATANYTAAGDDALDAVRCRSKAGLSVMFSNPIVEWVGGARVIAGCNLHEVSVCRNPAYRSSEVVAGAMRINAFIAALPCPRMERLEQAEAKLAGGVRSIPQSVAS